VEAAAPESHADGDAEATQKKIRNLNKKVRLTTNEVSLEWALTYLPTTYNTAEGHRRAEGKEGRR
jgi:hypothetical protein